MKNADLPAMPQSLAINENEGYTINELYGHNGFDGLTKREMFAMHAMQGILSSIAQDEIGYDKWDQTLAEHSVKAADALLKELEKWT